MRLPREIGPIHFVGIGGIGMSGIAEVLSNLGYTVQGSDASEGANVTRLREKGINVSVGHKAGNVAGADVLVVSTAIKRDNPELMAARAQRIPVVRRAEMLAELMRLKSCVAIAGTHGKTTTTSLVAALLDSGGLDPTVINGGITDRRIITYGENAQADVRLVNLDNTDGKQRFSVVFRDRDGKDVHTIKDLVLPMPGRHNALNATSAVAVAHELKIADDKIRGALAKFGGVKRRFTKVGEWNGAIIIDDYGHHPVEIAAVLKAARESTKGQVIAVMQPHRYTRLKTLFEPFSTCFNDADAVVVAQVYPAGEAPIEGADRDHLVQALRARGHRQVIALDGPEKLAGIVKDLAKPGDYVVLLGAGSITQWAYALPGELKALR